VALLLAVLGAYGIFLVYTSLAFGWRGLGLGPSLTHSKVRRRKLHDWLAQAGVEGVATREFVAVMVTLCLVGMALGFALFGGVVPPIVAGAFAATFPFSSYRARRERRRAEAREAWPRMIEEIRVRTGSLGRSIPQALFEVGSSGPEELRPAFAAAEREWRLSTDFARTVATLKGRLADATADATLETLLVAHEVGGSGLERRLLALAEDRVQDLQGRKDARAKQAGVRFARWFVLLVPLGMTLAGLSIGTGKNAYQTGAGQLAVAAGLVCVAACWAWAAVS
jgi:tight adherence protein B